MGDLTGSMERKQLATWARPLTRVEAFSAPSLARSEEAAVDRVEGRKIYASGRMLSGETLTEHRAFKRKRPVIHTYREPSVI